MWFFEMSEVRNSFTKGEENTSCLTTYQVGSRAGHWSGDCVRRNGKTLELISFGPAIHNPVPYGTRRVVRMTRPIRLRNLTIFQIISRIRGKQARILDGMLAVKAKDSVQPWRVVGRATKDDLRFAAEINHEMELEKAGA